MHASSAPRLALPSWVRLRRLDRVLFAVTLCSVLLLAAFWLLVSSGEGSEPRLAISESLQSGDEREGPMEKMDSKGRFQRFEGLTVIMPVNTSLNPAVYQQVYDLIYTLYGGVVSPLPVDSYHVTLTGVITRSRYATVAEYNAVVAESRPQLESAKWQLTNNAQQQRSITFRVEDARLGFRAVSFTLRPSTDADEAELRRLNVLMDSSLGKLYQRQPRWHMSVAYRYLGRTIEPAEFKPLETSLMDVFRFMEIVVTPPVLCAFYDMRQFRPI